MVLQEKAFNAIKVRHHARFLVIPTSLYYLCLISAKFCYSYISYSLIFQFCFFKLFFLPQALCFSTWWIHIFKKMYFMEVKKTLSEVAQNWL